MIGEAKKCPREVFFGKTLSCTDVSNQSERDDESAERPLDCDYPDPETSDKTARMVTEAQETGKSDALLLMGSEAARNRLSSRVPQSNAVFCRNWHFWPAGHSSKSEPYR
jgi:hypothetical protein